MDSSYSLQSATPLQPRERTIAASISLNASTRPKRAEKNHALESFPAEFILVPQCSASRARRRTRAAADPTPGRERRHSARESRLATLAAGSPVRMKRETQHSRPGRAPPA